MSSKYYHLFLSTVQACIGSGCVSLLAKVSALHKNWKKPSKLKFLPFIFKINLPWISYEPHGNFADGEEGKAS